MLNIFPIQFLAPLAYTILRVALGFIFMRIGVRHIQQRRESPSSSSLFLLVLGLAEIGAGLLFLLGAFTQIAALTGIAVALLGLFFPKRFPHPYDSGRIFTLLILAASLSLFITGAGIFGFDLPI